MVEPNNSGRMDLGGGGVGFSKRKIKLKNFFRSTKLIFRALPKHYKDPILDNFSAPQGKLEKMAKKGVFSVRAPPSKLLYIGAKSGYRNFLGSVRQKRISEKKNKVGPFGSPGGRIPEERRRPTAPLPSDPKTAPVTTYSYIIPLLFIENFFSESCSIMKQSRKTNVLNVDRIRAIQKT